MNLRTKFQDEDFELGEVVDGAIIGCLGKHEEEIRVIAIAAKGGQHTFYYSSIKDFTDHWEDAPEEPKEYWYIDWAPEIRAYNTKYYGSDYDKRLKQIGNYFDTKKEAEEALEKLKAWKRLKEKGFKFVGWCDSAIDEAPDMALFKLNKDAWETDTCEDLDICFGGEE